MADTHELTPEPNADGGHDATDPWGLPERTAQDAPELTQAEQRRRRAKAALALKVRGATLTDIAEVLEYASTSSARQAIEQILAEVAEMDGPAAWQTQRNLARLRYEGLLAEVYPVATDRTDEGFFQAQRSATIILDRLSVLDGLNAPSRHVIYTPAAAEFDETIAKVLAASGVHEAVEGDIFELTAAPIPMDEETAEEIEEEYEDAVIIEEAGD